MLLIIVFDNELALKMESLFSRNVGIVPTGSTVDCVRILYVVFNNYYYLFLVALRPHAGHSLHIHEVSRSHTTTHHSR